MKVAILLLLVSTLLLQSHAATPDAVLDTLGNTLLPGVDYYVLPVIRGHGGLTLASRNNTCPLTVAQLELEISEGLSDGLPVAFSPVDPEDSVVRLSTDHNVQFSAVTICVQSTVWRLGGTDEATGRKYVITGGEKGNPGRETVSNWFKIEEYEGNYKLVFCPQVCSICKVICGDLGIFVEDGQRWLGFTGDVPFPVMFKKA